MDRTRQFEDHQNADERYDDGLLEGESPNGDEAQDDRDYPRDLRADEAQPPVGRHGAGFGGPGLASIGTPDGPRRTSPERSTRSERVSKTPLESLST